jgi:hypothetical protein
LSGVILEGIKRDETISKKSNKKDCGKKENMGHFLFINPSKQTITEDEINYNFNKTKVGLF